MVPSKISQSAILYQSVFDWFCSFFHSGPASSSKWHAGFFETAEEKRGERI
jgi:hypothetical protein